MMQRMSKLKQALQFHGIDAANLDVLFGTGKGAVHGLRTDGASAVEIWRRLRLAAGEIGYWPLILGREKDLEQHRESFAMMSEESGRGSVMDIIAAGSKVDVTEWLTERAAGELEPAPLDSDPWPEGDLATHQFTLPSDGDRPAASKDVVIGLAPTVIGWQIPAFLRFGGWNACPAPEHHVAMLKYWRHAYGAEIVCLGGSMLEVAVSRPPTDRNAALRLAREQYVYCPDVVRLSGNSLKGRAATLLGATAWSFWWE